MIVVDASIVLKIFFEEEGREDAIKLLEGESKKVVPELLFLEVANTLATKVNSNPEKIKQGLQHTYDLGFEIHKIDKDDLTEAAILAKKYKVAVYDAIYWHLARKLKVKLVTADKRFAEKIGDKRIKVI